MPITMTSLLLLLHSQDGSLEAFLGEYPRIQFRLVSWYGTVLPLSLLLPPQLARERIVVRILGIGSPYSPRRGILQLLSNP